MPDGGLVVGYDQRPAAAAAIRLAASLATRLSVDVHVVHAIDLSDYPLDPDASDWEERAEQTCLQEKSAVERLMADFAGAWTYHAERGDPLRVLAAVATEHDALMVIIGSHGDGFGTTLMRVFDGSVERRLLSKHLSRPVLVVPDDIGTE